jgi:transposase
MERTSFEQRNEKIATELFPITEEQKREMILAKENAEQQYKQKIGDEKKEDSINFREYNIDQDFFLVIERKKFLDSQHPAAIIDLVVERLDLRRIIASYSKEGNPSYNPTMMLKILFYAYYLGIMSCRTIWDSVIHRSDFIFLACGQVPNFRTINAFRIRHIDEIPGLFTQIVMLCKELEMIGFEYLAVDGQKIQGNASYTESKTIGEMKKEYERIKNGIEKIVNTEVQEYPSQKTKDERVTKLEKRLEKLAGFISAFDGEIDEKERINMTDIDAKVMTHKDGQKLPSYTHQSVRDSLLGVVTAVQTTQNGDIPADLEILLDQSIKNTEETHEKVMADCGFCDYETLVKVEEERDEDVYLPDRRFESSKNDKTASGKYQQEAFTKDAEGNYMCPRELKMELKNTLAHEDGHKVFVYHGTGCSECSLKTKCCSGKVRTISIDSRMPYRDLMRKKLTTDAGREIYSKRQGLIESLHGDDQKNKKWTQHHLRQLKKAALEFLLIRIAGNLGLIIKHRADVVIEFA